MKLGSFTSESCSDCKEMYKKCDKCVFASLKRELIAFLPILLSLLSLLLKLLIAFNLLLQTHIMKA